MEKMIFGVEYPCVSVYEIRAYSESTIRTDREEDLMKNILIHLYAPEASQPEIKVTLPLSSLGASIRVLPRRVKDNLKREGIDLLGLRKIGKEGCRSGKLIEIERSDGKIVISSEASFPSRYHA